MKILAFGDSLTEGERTPAFWGSHDPGTPGVAMSYPFKLWTILTTTYTAQTIQIFNGGRGGEKVATSGARERFADSIRTYQPQLIILMHGANDILEPTTDRVIIVNALEELIADAQARGVTVFLSTLPPQFDGFGREVAADRVPRLNDDLRRMASAKGVTLVDVFPHITREMSSDGLHLTQAGNQKLADVYYEAIKARYHQAPSIR